MEWFTESAGSLKTATGKPAHLCVNGGGAVKTYCGLPHELGSTGFGVAEAAIIALKAKKIPVKNAKIAIHGFGNVGFFAYKFLVEAGAKVILIAKEKGVILKEDGFNLPVIEKIFQEKKSVISDYPGAKRLSHEDFWKVPVDVLIPASITDVINEKNKKYIKAQIIVEGANIPIREEIENELWKKRILIVPDFVANAGGVISSYCEYRGYSSSEMFRMVKKKIRKITKMVLNESLKRKMNPRSVALLIAKEKIERKMK